MSSGRLVVGALLLNALLFAAVIAKPLKAPRGWDDSMMGHSRVLTKGNSRIVIGPWQSLDGQTLDVYLTTMEQQVPEGAEFVSSGGVKVEGKQGAFSVVRKIKLDGWDGHSILLACPGLPGYGRIMEGSFPDKEFGNLMTGGLFADKVCRKEPKGGAAEAVASVQEHSTTDTNHTAEKQTSENQSDVLARGSDAALENSKIPESNRPVSSVVLTKIVMRGFNPVIPVAVPRMVSTYPNGYSTTCTKWDMVTSEPIPQSIGSEKCELKKVIPDSWGDDPTSLEPFKAGETIEIAFGSVSSAGTFNFGGAAGTFSSLSLGDLVMTKEGNIAFGKKVFLETSAGWPSSKKQHVGKYFLDGYTMTVITDRGEVVHTTIGILGREGGKITSLLLGNEFYSD